MIACQHQIVLPSGYVVPCGTCEVCRSNARNEWSIRVQMQCKYSDRMPLMIGLDYAPEWLPKDYYGNPKLLRDDVSKFIKAYKRKYILTNDKFLYFGCGEYGGLHGRPHYHLVTFGDNDLYDLFYCDESKANERLKCLWPYGRVWIGIAQWSGIHYITKYVLKDEDSNENPGVPSFTISSKGLGMNFLDSPEALEIKKRLQWLQYNRDEVYRNCPFWSPDNLPSVEKALEYFRQFVPRFQVTLESGKTVPLPRVFRKKLLGTFEHWKDNPLWLPQQLKSVRDMLVYYRDHPESYNQEQYDLAIIRIRQRLLKVQYDKNLKKSRYESIRSSRN